MAKLKRNKKANTMEKRHINKSREKMIHLGLIFLKSKMMYLADSNFSLISFTLLVWFIKLKYNLLMSYPAYPQPNSKAQIF